MLPSGPAVMPERPAFEASPSVVPNTLVEPSGASRTILLAPVSTNHRLPSGPRVIASGPLTPAIGYSVIVGAAKALGVTIASTSDVATAAPSSLAR